MSELVNVISEISGILAKDDGAEDKVRHALKVISESFNATNCTFHRADLGDSFLHMVCQIGLPDHHNKENYKEGENGPSIKLKVQIDWDIMISQ